MNNEIGIGILDVYDQEDLESCYNSIPEELKQNVLVASCSNNKMVNENYRKYNDVPFATLRNWLTTQFRIQEKKYFFLINSNQTITDVNLFENIIKLAEVFGTWMMTGPGSNNVELEDDTAGVTLNLSPELNTDFIFLLSGIVKNNGLFDERYFNSKDLDVLDYIIKLRTKGVYPPAHFNPTIGSGVKKTNTVIKKTGFKDIPDQHRSVGLSYGYFMHLHRYIPTQNDPVGVTQEQLLQSVDTIQKTYAKK